MNDKTRKQILDLLNRMEAEPLPSEVLEQVDYCLNEEDPDVIYNFILREIKEREFETTQTLTRREKLLLHQAVFKLIGHFTRQRAATSITGLQKAFDTDIQELMRLEEKLLLRMGEN